jgi:hypothetical protein
VDTPVDASVHLQQDLRMLMHWSLCKDDSRLWHWLRQGKRQLAFCNLHCHDALNVSVAFCRQVSALACKG